MAQQMIDLCVDTVVDRYDRTELFSTSLLFHTVYSSDIRWQKSHRWKLTALNRKDAGTFLICEIISYTTIVVTVLYKQKCTRTRCHVCLQLANGKNM